MSKYRYSDLILQAFMEFRRPMSMDEVVEYVAEMTDCPFWEVRLPVDNTLTAAWLHGFVERDNDLYTLELPDRTVNHGTRSDGSSVHLCCSFNPRRHFKRL
ncbi:hypothetical protein KR044_011920 [Drosophila immigrans]|nr:hypothetical protein KR044_011920 [Drosophila immigrans]